MHHSIIATTAMESESHMATTDHGPYSSGGHTPASAGGVSVGDSHWVDMSHYTQTTMADYNSNFNFGMTSMPHLPSESLGVSVGGVGVGVGVSVGVGMGGGRMLPPPPQVAQVPQQHPPPPHQQQAHHPPLQPLIMPSNPIWPSTLVPNASSYSAPAASMPPLVSLPQLKGSKLSASHIQLTPRKTLTDSDRRAMCLFAEENPGMKQTEIGSRFGVERSTVSKVLRKKETYLNPDDRSASPIKRAKQGKTADIEKALLNWLRNQQKLGAPVTDTDIREKARVFAQNTSGPSPDSLLTASTVWLEKFKQKYNVGGPKLLRRASETNIPHSATSTISRDTLSGSAVASPASPQAHHPHSASVEPSQSPLSANPSKSDDERDASVGGGGSGSGNNNRASTFMDFTSESGSYRHSHNQSSTSLSSTFTDSTASSFSGSAVSPNPFTFSPDPSTGGFFSSAHGSSNFQRPRSQTFPTLDIDLMNQPQSGGSGASGGSGGGPGGGGSGEPLTPKYHPVPSTAPSSALESPMNEMLAQPFAIDTSVSSASVVASPHLHRSSSSGSLAPRSATVGTPVTSAGGGMTSGTPTGSSPNSPTQEDARRAADTLLSFIQQNAGGFVDQSDYIAVVRLTEKLRLHHHQLAKAVSAASAPGMGGLTRIPEGEVEMTNAPAAIETVKLEPTTMAA